MSDVAPDLTVRRADKGDLPAVLALYAALNDGRTLALEDAEGRLERFARYPDYGLYVAELDDRPGPRRIVGTFCLAVLDNIARWGTPSGLVEAVVVADGHRGAGLGRAMMREAFRLAEAAGCYKVALSSNVGAEAAHRFYEGLGFERYGHSFRLDPRASNGEAA